MYGFGTDRSLPCTLAATPGRAPRHRVQFWDGLVPTVRSRGHRVQLRDVTLPTVRGYRPESYTVGRLASRKCARWPGLVVSVARKVAVLINKCIRFPLGCSNPLFSTSFIPLTALCIPLATNLAALHLSVYFLAVFASFFMRSIRLSYAKFGALAAMYAQHCCNAFLFARVMPSFFVVASYAWIFTWMKTPHFFWYAPWQITMPLR